MAMAATTQPIFVPSAGQKWSSPSGRSLLTMPPVNGSSRNLVVNNMHSHGLRLRTEPLPGKTRLFRTRSIKASTVSAGETVHGVQSLSISETFENLRKLGKVAFVPYITAGDPDLLTTAKALKVLDSCGSDIIELGVPYSDPLADGPVIQAAATRALQNGTNFDAVISMLREVIPQLTAPVVLFSYYNPILKRGLERFMHTIRYVGVRGLVIPDVPLEETETLRQITAANKIELVLLTTPTTPIERMKMIVEASKGFIYLVSIAGVTGARASVESRVEALLRDIKKSTTKPVAVGFGISTPEHVSQARAHPSRMAGEGSTLAAWRYLGTRGANEPLAWVFMRWVMVARLPTVQPIQLPKRTKLLFKGSLSTFRGRLSGHLRIRIISIFILQFFNFSKLHSLG